MFANEISWTLEFIICDAYWIVSFRQWFDTINRLKEIEINSFRFTGKYGTNVCL